jgi:hypothetical protein
MAFWGVHDSALLPCDSLPGPGRTFHRIYDLLEPARDPDHRAGLFGQVEVARLLFGMGRDNVIPRGFFADLDPKRKTPTRNIWLIGIVAYLGAMLISYAQAEEILNFGAFLAFLGVNLTAYWPFAALRQPGRRRRWPVDVVMTLSGFLFCLWVWPGLKTPAKVVGGLWLLAGLAYCAVKARGSCAAPAMIDFREQGWRPTCLSHFSTIVGRGYWHAHGAAATAELDVIVEGVSAMHIDISGPD